MSDLRIDDRNGVRVIFLSRGKANPLNTGFAAEIFDATHEAEKDPAVRAVVLTSASKIFCGGFDLGELAQADAETFSRFIKTVETLFFGLFLLQKPLVAALTGHAVAGGLIVAGAADFRFAAEGSGRMGLPEANLGVHVPRYTLEAMRVSLGDRALTRFALGGDTVPFAEARELGAIDRIVPEAQLLDESVAWAAHLGKAPSEVYAAIKHDLRSAAVERAREVLVDGRKAFVDSWFSDVGQKGIAATLSRMGK